MIMIKMMMMMVIRIRIMIFIQGTHFTKGDIQCRGRSRGRVQGVRNPPPRDDLRFSNTTGILPKKKNYVVYWC